MRAVTVWCIITFIPLLVNSQFGGFNFGLNFPQAPSQSTNNNNFLNPFFNYNSNNQWQQQQPQQSPYTNNVFLQNNRPPPPPPPLPTQRPPVRNTSKRPQTNRPMAIASNGNFNANQRISERKCSEYTRRLGGQQVVSSLALDATFQSIDIERCENSISLVVGGENAKAGEFPHMAAIGYPEGLTGRVGFYCGGTLVSEKYVLTAAHCRAAGREKPIVVRVGELNLAQKDEGLPELDILIDQFIVHESYNSREHKNDIAVIRLKSNVPFSKLVHPACLGQLNTVVNRKAIATGWGFTEVAGATADILQRVDLSVIPNSECSYHLQELFDSPSDYTVDNTQMCAGELKGGKDTCQGDSGGPLVIPSTNNKCMYVLIGITSYGTPFCGRANSPGVYTRVSAYLDWIEQKVWGST